MQKDVLKQAEAGGKRRKAVDFLPECSAGTAEQKKEAVPEEKNMNDQKNNRQHRKTSVPEYETIREAFVEFLQKLLFFSLLPLYKGFTCS